MCALSTLLTQGNSGANSSLHFAELAQLVERRLAKAKVAGSNPVFRSNKAPDSVIFSSGSGAGVRVSPQSVTALLDFASGCIGTRFWGLSLGNETTFEGCLRAGAVRPFR